MLYLIRSCNCNTNNGEWYTNKTVFLLGEAPLTMSSYCPSDRDGGVSIERGNRLVVNCSTFQKLVLHILGGSQVAMYQSNTKDILDKKPFSQLLSKLKFKKLFPP